MHGAVLDGPRRREGPPVHRAAHRHGDPDRRFVRAHRLPRAGRSPPHVHRLRDEGFYILDGSFTFTLSEDVVEARAGSFVFVPRGTRHGFTVEPGGRALLFIVPAGLEGFFEELGRGLAAGRSGPEIREALAGKYDSTPL